VTKTYDQRLQEQIDQYRDTENMQDLPAIYDPWGENYILPGLTQVFGIGDINLFFVEAFFAAAKHNADVPVFLSLGCGDGTTEIGIAKTLSERGMMRFRFVCYELSSILLSRFQAALPVELAERFELVTGDLNSLALDTRFDAIMANHSLHHIVNLEGVFSTAFDNLAEHGIFVTNDMIGRNGHMRWPETRLFVEYFWPFMPQRQRWNVILRREEPRFIDFDYDGESFEGIRAQDVLPTILAQGFRPWKFFSFGGMVDVFVDRCFGPNFDIADEDDLFLVQRIGLLNDILLDLGAIKPTMMLAYFVKYPVQELCYRDRSAAKAVRNSTEDPKWLQGAMEDVARKAVEPDYAFKEGTIRYYPVELPAEFDRVRYLVLHPDVAAAGMDPVRHYLDFGWREGRRLR
jgi:SAM-dependent methyltransferase